MVSDDYRDWIIEQLRRSDPTRPVQYYEVPTDLVEKPAAPGERVEGAVAVARSRKRGE